MPVRVTNDYKVDFRREERIAEIAAAWRALGVHPNTPSFNIVEFVEKVLPKHLRKRKGPFRIELMDTPDGAVPAWVSYDPLVLHIDRAIWGLARDGEEVARFIVAHEIGHIVLHDHNAKAFSADKSARLEYAPEEYSAEWQAHIFAAYFLLPTNIVEAIADARRLVIACLVPRRLADERLAALAPRVKYDGNACGVCGNFTLLPHVRGFRCSTCGRVKPWDEVVEPGASAADR